MIMSTYVKLDLSLYNAIKQLKQVYTYIYILCMCVCLISRKFTGAAPYDCADQ